MLRRGVVAARQDGGGGQENLGLLLVFLVVVLLWRGVGGWGALASSFSSAGGDKGGEGGSGLRGGVLGGGAGGGSGVSADARRGGEGHRKTEKSPWGVGFVGDGCVVRVGRGRRGSRRARARLASSRRVHMSMFRPGELISAWGCVGGGGVEGGPVSRHGRARAQAQLAAQRSQAPLLRPRRLPPAPPTPPRPPSHPGQ